MEEVKYIMTTIDNEITSVWEYEGNVTITSDISDIYITELDKLIVIAEGFNIEDISQLTDLKRL